MSWGSIWQTNLKMVGKDNVLRFNEENSITGTQVSENIFERKG